jgi:RNA polymerase sigma factor (sigma-70 family)
VTVTSPIIHVVDDDPSFRAAIGELLNACGYQVALHGSAAQLLATHLGDEPACILLDVQMPGVDGPQLQARLAELGHRLPIVFLTGHGDIPTSVQAIKAGAQDFLTKPVRKEKLLLTIERALAHGEQIRAMDRRIAVLRSLVARLTPRERNVFDLLVRGKPHKQIAYALGTTERTIKMHRHNLMQKCQVNSLADLTVIAERLGLLPAPGDGENEQPKPPVTTSAASDDGPAQPS